MASESNFTGLGDFSPDIVAANWDVVSILNVLLSILALRKQDPHPRHGDNLFTFESEPLSYNIHEPSLPLRVSVFPTTGFLPASFLEMPPRTPSAPGVMLNFFHSPQTSHETSNFRPRTTTTPPRNTVRAYVLFSVLNWDTEGV